MPTWEHAKTPFIQLQSFERENEKGEASHDKKKAEKKRKLLTSSNKSSTTSASRRIPATQRQDKAQPAQSQFLTATVKIRDQGICSLELAQLASVWWVADGEYRLKPAGATGYRAAVYPDIKTITTAISTIATLADATKWQGRDVKGGVVARNTAGTGGGDN